MKLTLDMCAELWTLAVKEAPREACGYLLPDRSLDPETCQIVSNAGTWVIHLALNLALEPHKEFWLHPDDFAEYKKKFPTLALWHSHPFGRWDLSRADKMLMFQTQVPMVVVAWQPYLAVVLYDLERGEIRRVEQQKIEGVTA